MNYRAISNILASVNNLDQVINSVVRSLSTEDRENLTLMSRLDSYQEILKRQKNLMKDLFEAYQRGEWENATRITNLIYGSSLMIEVDVGFMLSMLKREEGTAKAA